MRSSWVAFAATTLLAGAAALLFPYATITPGTLGEGHGALKNDCLACHSPLQGAPRARCIACHDLGRLGLSTVAGVARATPNSKAHGLHKAIGEAACAGCHAGHAGWGLAAADARFVHGVLPEAIRADCAACHAADRPKDALHAPLERGCGSCHGTGRWKPATYDHDRYFRFDGNHPARCADCHTTPGDFKRYSCTGCHEHALPKMIAEHREEQVVDLEKCARCHRSGDEHDIVGGRGEGEGRRRKGKDGKERDD